MPENPAPAAKRFTNIAYNGILSSTPPMNLELGWTRKPDPDKLTHIAHIIRTAQAEKITERNYRRWLVELVGFNVPGKAALCPNGQDHACNRGLGHYLGIEPYGQTGAGADASGDKPAQHPWELQMGFSAERFNRHAAPQWVEALLALDDLKDQRRMYAHLIEEVRDHGRFVYHIPVLTVRSSETPIRPLSTKIDDAQAEHDAQIYGSDVSAA